MIVPSAFVLAVAIGVFKFPTEYKLNVNSSALGKPPSLPDTTFLAVILTIAGIGLSLRFITEPAAPNLRVYSFSSSVYPAGAVFSFILKSLPSHF